MSFTKYNEDNCRIMEDRFYMRGKDTGSPYFDYLNGIHSRESVNGWNHKSRQNRAEGKGSI